MIIELLKNALKALGVVVDGVGVPPAATEPVGLTDQVVVVVDDPEIRELMLLAEASLTQAERAQKALRHAEVDEDEERVAAERANVEFCESAGKMLTQLFWVIATTKYELWPVQARADVRGLTLRRGWEIVTLPEKSMSDDFGDALSLILGNVLGGGMLRRHGRAGGSGDESALAAQAEERRMRRRLESESDEELARIARRDCGNPRCKIHAIAAEVLEGRRQRAEAQRIADEIDEAAAAAATKPEEEHGVLIVDLGRRETADDEEQSVVGANEPAEEMPPADEQQSPEEETTGEGANEPAAVGETADDGSGTPAGTN